ncbi:MAG: NUDIX domain-containing protein [Deltaproteobacteria bacterium]|nr:NUDIX domain-containing protein [Deltaproteobacteria bacterium]
MEKRVTFAVKGIVFKDNKFLIVKRKDCTPDVWELPGGHLEFGETAEETIVREMKEETNLNVKPTSLLETWNSYFHNRQITGIIYKCEALHYQVKLSDEHSEYKWISHIDGDFNILHPVFREKMLEWDWNSII